MPDIFPGPRRVCRDQVEFRGTQYPASSCAETVFFVNSRWRPHAGRPIPKKSDGDQECQDDHGKSLRSEYFVDERRENANNRCGSGYYQIARLAGEPVRAEESRVT